MTAAQAVARGILKISQLIRNTASLSGRWPQLQLLHIWSGSGICGKVINVGGKFAAVIHDIYQTGHRIWKKLDVRNCDPY